MNAMYLIETDALPVNAQRISSEATGFQHGALQGGRLGTMLSMDKESADKVAVELREYGYQAWVSQGVGG